MWQYLPQKTTLFGPKFPVQKIRDQNTLLCKNVQNKTETISPPRNPNLADKRVLFLGRLFWKGLLDIKPWGWGNLGIWDTIPERQFLFSIMLPTQNDGNSRCCPGSTADPGFRGGKDIVSHLFHFDNSPHRCLLPLQTDAVILNNYPSRMWIWINLHVTLKNKIFLF